MCRIYNILLLFTVILGANSITTATVKNWNNASGGSWFTPGNWTPAGVPAAGDSVDITLSGSYTVSIDIDTLYAYARRVALGGVSGQQTLRIGQGGSMAMDYPESSGALEIFDHGVLEIHGGTLYFGEDEGLSNSGVVLIDSSSIIYLGWYSAIGNSGTGEMYLNGPATIDGHQGDGVYAGTVDNHGNCTIMAATGTVQISTNFLNTDGSLLHQSGELVVYHIENSDTMTLSDGTLLTLMIESQWNQEVGMQNYPEGWPGGSILMEGSAEIGGEGIFENGGTITHTGTSTGLISCPYAPIIGEVPQGGPVNVNTGGLALTGSPCYIMDNVSIGLEAVYEVREGSIDADATIASAAADSGTVVFGGSASNLSAYGLMTFSGDLHILGGGGTVEMNTPASSVSFNVLTVDSDALFVCLDSISVAVANIQGTMTADLTVRDQWEWSGGDISGNTDSAFVVDPGVSLIVSGPDPKTLDSTDLVIDGDASLSGSGELTVTGGAAIVVGSGGTLTIGDSLTITGVGDTLFNYGAMTVNCPLDTSRLNLYVYNGPTAGRTPGTIDIPSGRVECNGGVGNDGTIIVGAGAELYLGELGSNSGSLEITDGALCTVDDTLLNLSSGTINLYGDGDIGGDGILMNEGHVNRNGSGLLTVTNSLLTTRFENSATGFLTINADTLTLTGGGSNAGDINIQLNCVLRIFGTFTNLPGGVIHGGGVLDVSNAVFTNEGTINPGSSPGTLAIVGNIMSSGIINIELAGLIPGTQYDRLLVSGSAVLGGTLNLSRLNGFIPTLTDSFHFLTYSGCTGEFAAVTGTPVGNGTYMEIAYGPTGIVQYVCDGISDIDVTPPSFTDTVFSGQRDTLTAQLCNLGHCPLEWTSSWVQTSPPTPIWLTIVEGGSGLLTRTQSQTARWAINTMGLALGNTYSGHVSISSNDPDEAVFDIPIQLVVPNITLFDIGGGGNDFPNFTAAVSWLTSHGVNAPTVFNVYPGTYNESVLISQVTGASAVNTITFASEYPDTPAVLRTVGYVLTLDGADHVVFDRINFTSLSDPSEVHCVRFENGADSNTIRNCTVTNFSTSNASCIGLVIESEGCDGNLIDGVTVLDSYTCIMAGDAMAPTGIGNEVRNCVLRDCVVGLSVTGQRGRFHHNDIQPEHASGGNVSGINLFSATTGDTSHVYANRIHGFDVMSGNPRGIYLNNTGGGVHYIYNNFICDWRPLSGSHYGIWVAAGRARCYFNSIHLDAPDGLSQTHRAVYLSTGSAQMWLLNNIFQLDTIVTQGSSYAIDRSSGTLPQSDYNCFDVPGANARVGRDGAYNCGTLASWRTRTGLDMMSIEGDPGFCSTIDLHIDRFYSLVDSAGMFMPGFVTDIDGEMRVNPPCIGADEYTVINDRVDDLVIWRSDNTNDMVLYWSAVPGANSYKIYRSQSGASNPIPTILLATTSVPGYVHTGIISTGPSLLVYHVMASTASP